MGQPVVSQIMKNVPESHMPCKLRKVMEPQLPQRVRQIPLELLDQHSTYRFKQYNRIPTTMAHSTFQQSFQFSSNIPHQFSQVLYIEM